jgi:cyclic pyranopterin phosphate synthase
VAEVAVTRDASAPGLALRISVTDRCPLRCLYCRPRSAIEASPAPEVLQRAEIVRFVRVACDAMGVAKVRLTGGEPLVRGDIVQIVAALGRLGITDIALTTNGQRLAAIARPLREAGLHRVNVSLDSLDPSTFARLAQGGELARTLAGIDSARAAGLAPVRINTVVLRGMNDHEAEAMVRLALAHGCEQRFIELMPSELSPADYDRWFFSSDELRQRLERTFDLAPQAPEPGSSSRRFLATGDGRKGFVGFISPTSHPFCSGCRRLRLTADGRLLGCLGREDHTPLMDLLRSGDASADDRIAGAMLGALSRKRGAGPFAVAMPMSSLGG